MNDSGGDHGHRLPEAFELQKLKILAALGRGANGVVFLVKNNSSAECLALKVVLKDCIGKVDTEIKSDGSKYRRIYFEQQVLMRFHHPLLPRLRGCLATEKVVGYMMDYCPGRDLHALRKRQSEHMFSDELIRFYAAEIVLALEYLHNLGIVHRDLKPENIMIQANGHIMLIDFDLSTKLPPKSLQPSPLISHRQSDSPTMKKRFSPFRRWCNSGISPEDSVSSSKLSTKTSAESIDSSDLTEKPNSFVGTEEYVAPEVILGKRQDYAVDWWALGVILYEMLYGTTPFKGKNKKETFHLILSKPADLVGETTSLRDLVRKLLEKDVNQRIELEGVKGHDFFRGIDWDSVMQISRPPYIPEVEEVANEKDAEGINEIDMELFVQGIFARGEGGETRKASNNEERTTV